MCVDDGDDRAVVPSGSVAFGLAPASSKAFAESIAPCAPRTSTASTTFGNAVITIPEVRNLELRELRQTGLCIQIGTAIGKNPYRGTVVFGCSPLMAVSPKRFSLALGLAP
jgi:hypothetical protein